MKPVFPVIIFFLFFVMAKHSFAHFQIVNSKSVLGNNVVKSITHDPQCPILLSDRDNGIGILQKVLDKIFQPFFTSKPKGYGTGLELSLSCDIMKAYSGELKVETKEGDGVKFVISLPITNNKNT